MPAVSNGSPLILYAKIGQLELMRELFDQIVIPRAVHDEVVRTGTGRSGAAAVAAASWIEVRSVKDRRRVRTLSARLDAGEAEVVALASEVEGLESVIIDDRDGRRLAFEQGLPVMGSAGVLLLAKERVVIPMVRPLPDQLRSAGLYLRDAMYLRVLATAHEQPLPHGG